MPKNNKYGPMRDMTLAATLSGMDPEELQRLAQNLFRATQEAQALVTQSMMSFGATLSSPDRHDPFGGLDAQAKLGSAIARHPEKVGNAMMALCQGWMALFESMASGAPLPQDRRFSDPEWTANPALDFIRRAWTLNADWLRGLVDAAAEDLDAETHRKAKFFIGQWIDMMAPTNLMATNPAAMRSMLETGGRSLSDGLRNLRKDFERGHGRLAMTQTDETAFRVGENVATAKGEVVYRNRLIEIIHYAPTRRKMRERPMLIFPPWINKFYVLDLQPENSMIRWLLSKRINTFVVSWRSADIETRNFKWDDYVEQGALTALDFVTKETGATDINTIGYCIGGTLLTSTMAHMAQKSDKRIHSATLFASQSDFEEAGELKVFTSEEGCDYLDTVIEDNDGLMPGGMMGETFNWLRPTDLVWRYVVDNYMLGKPPKPFDLLYWNADQTNIPGPTHKTYLKQLYNRNELARGTFKVLGTPVSMADITTPIFVQASRSDHICPWQSICRGARNYGGDVTFTLAGSGHIAGVINPPSAQKYQHWVNPDFPEKPEAWLAGASEIAGSWWPSWWQWLKARSGKKVKATPPVPRGLGSAPGQFVTLRLSDIRQGRQPAGPYSVDLEREARARAWAKASAGKKSRKAAKAKAKLRAETGASIAEARASGAKTKPEDRAKTKSKDGAKTAPKAQAKVGARPKAKTKTGAKPDPTPQRSRATKASASRTRSGTSKPPSARARAAKA